MSSAAHTPTVARAEPRPAPPPNGQGHDLVLRSASCWLGGFWSDALGETATEREAGIRDRCVSVIRTIGESPQGAYYAVRALDSANVDLIAQEVWRLASRDPKERPFATDLVRLLYGVADVSRETMHARSAADRVKEVFRKYTPEEERENKVFAAPELLDANAFRMLLTQGGAYWEEARVLAIFHALDRMEIARGLPKHLKIYALATVNQELFGVAPPELGSDPAAPIPTGTWLAYLSRVADAAGHPVPSDAKKPDNREPLAWNGALVGFADKLRVTRTPALEAVALRVVTRLDDQARSARTTFDALPPADR